MDAEPISFDCAVLALRGAAALERMGECRHYADISRQIDAAAGRIPLLEIRPWPPTEYAHLARERRSPRAAIGAPKSFLARGDFLNELPFPDQY